MWARIAVPLRYDISTMAMLTKRAPSAASAFGAAFLLVALLAGCSTGSGTSSTPALSPTTTAPPTDPPTAATSTLPFEGGRDAVAVDVDPSGQGASVLIDVRSAPHTEFDRIVFEFSGALPGYRVEYTSAPLVACGSGGSLEVAGDAVLQVRFASATAHGIEPRRLILQLGSLREAIISCDFEGDVTWLLGLSAEADFAVTGVDQRVVIDVAHP